MQEFICSPEDILGYHPEREGDASIAPLACTVTALLSHATSPQRSPNDISHPRYQTHAYGEEYDHDTEASMEVNYHQRQRNRYEDRYVSNFNNFSDYTQYTIDESEEYQVNYENNSEAHDGQYSPVYGTNDGVRNRGPYYHTNRVQFVTPFCKGASVLKCDNFEIYDTDEVDYVSLREEEDVERYDRSKMNLEIENNLNRDMNAETDAPINDEQRLLVTCLCLGTFFVSAILLIIYPL